MTPGEQWAAVLRLVAVAPEMRDFMDYQANIIGGLIERLSDAGLVDDMDRVEFNKWSQEYQQIVEKAEVKP